ncbi:MAG: glycosyltransferase family 2 protein [Pseudomonadota bacterium]
MKLTLLIGPGERATQRFRAMLQHHQKDLRKLGVHVPDWNHVRLFAAVQGSDKIGYLRHRRGLDHPQSSDVLYAEFEDILARDVREMAGEHVVLAAAQLGSLLTDRAPLMRLHRLLAPYFDKIEVVAHVQAQARALCAHYCERVADGRRVSLASELNLLSASDWWAAALAYTMEAAPEHGDFADLHQPPPWLDYTALLAHWESVFGVGHTRLAPLSWDALRPATAWDAFAEPLRLPLGLGPVPQASPLWQPPAAWVTRMRHMNEVLLRYARAQAIYIPNEPRRQALQRVEVAGPPMSPGSLSAVSERFANQNASLIAQFPALASALIPPEPAPQWEEADPTLGFRATQYLAAFAPALDKAATPLADKRAEAAAEAAAGAAFDKILVEESPTDQRLLNQLKVNHRVIRTSHFQPHNDFGTVDEARAAPPFTALSNRPPSHRDVVAVSCMKDEAPYILEWIAHHRAVGIDHFLIYTNDCEDGTVALLHRLEEIGLVTHRDNSDWRGNSPQQHALNRAMNEPVLRAARWITHIDVDEFINIRVGNGTLSDFWQAVPQATHIAMTWRLFGNNGVQSLQDDLVVNQFDRCAPRYCPKPHTTWGLKTLFRNSGAYAKLSCHRPNKLQPGREKDVLWVNGAGRDVTGALRHRGWRSSRATIGYDLLQLNHYALRSVESFLIKRNRGRALHVDRSIGLNYWIRMDWSVHQDLTIQRNLPRLHAARDKLLRDPVLRACHERGLDWHKRQAKMLIKQPAFAALYDQISRVKLNATERATYAMSLGTES